MPQPDIEILTAVEAAERDVATFVAVSDVKVLPPNLAARVETIDNTLKESRELLKRATEARDDAREAGLRAGREEARAEMQAMRTSLLRDAEDDLVTLALELARRVLGHQISVDPASLATMVSASIDDLADVENATIYVHPYDIDHTREGLKRWHANLKTDPSVRQGTARLETVRGVAHIGIDEKLDVLAAALRADDGAQP